MMILGIDPGTRESGWVIYDSDRRFPVMEAGKTGNQDVRNKIVSAPEGTIILVEMVSNYGKAVGDDTYRTVRWAGRFEELAFMGGRKFYTIKRNKVKSILTGRVQGINDSALKTYIENRFGGKAVAIGGKKCLYCKGKGWKGRGRESCGECNGSGYEIPPGPLHMIKRDAWQALALVLAYLDREAERCRLLKKPPSLLSTSATARM